MKSFLFLFSSMFWISFLLFLLSLHELRRSFNFYHDIKTRKPFSRYQSFHVVRKWFSFFSLAADCALRRKRTPKIKNRFVFIEYCTLKMTRRCHFLNVHVFNAGGRPAHSHIHVWFSLPRWERLVFFPDEMLYCQFTFNRKSVTAIALVLSDDSKAIH